MKLKFICFRGIYSGALMLESKQVVEDIKILLEE